MVVFDGSVGWAEALAKIPPEAARASPVEATRLPFTKVLRSHPSLTGLPFGLVDMGTPQRFYLEFPFSAPVQSQCIAVPPPASSPTWLFRHGRLPPWRVWSTFATFQRPGRLKTALGSRLLETPQRLPRLFPSPVAPHRVPGYPAGSVHPAAAFWDSPNKLRVAGTPPVTTTSEAGQGGTIAGHPRMFLLAGGGVSREKFLTGPAQYFM